MNVCSVGEMILTRGNPNTRAKPVPVLLCPPQIPHELASDRTLASTLGGQRQTA